MNSLPQFLSSASLAQSETPSHSALTLLMQAVALHWKGHFHSGSPGYWWVIKAPLRHSHWYSGNRLREVRHQAGVGVAQDPVAELCDARVDPRPVDLSTAHSPTHHPSQEEPPRGPLTHQRPPRVTLWGKHNISVIFQLICAHGLPLEAVGGADQPALADDGGSTGHSDDGPGLLPSKMIEWISPNPGTSRGRPCITDPRPALSRSWTKPSEYC
ncbi:hypothetical protein F7725_027349 [Dissostichus mawsoni]|uniref:Uncharacterized protein n=1 Tax=Dissostichus mawsoni TaxID=36200 RepID=A0A7J5XCW6_DISMA|nr:hypothetical protein F7725_027349 [Dissostichus mawsoni]